MVGIIVLGINPQILKEIFSFIEESYPETLNKNVVGFVQIGLSLFFTGIIALCKKIGSEKREQFYVKKYQKSFRNSMV